MFLVALSEKEQKLLRLALDTGAFGGEADNAAIMFVRSLRERAVRPDELITGRSKPRRPRAETRRSPRRLPGSAFVRMPWGKYEGVRLVDVPGYYLVWALGWIRQDETRLDRMAVLLCEIEDFLTWCAGLAQELGGGNK